MMGKNQIIKTTYANYTRFTSNHTKWITVKPLLKYI